MKLINSVPASITWPGRITDQLDAMSEQDHLRRRLVAQVSHDSTHTTRLHSRLSGKLTTQGRQPYQLRSAQNLSMLPCVRASGCHAWWKNYLNLLASTRASEHPIWSPVPLPNSLMMWCKNTGSERRKTPLICKLMPRSNYPWQLVDIAMLERVFDNLIDNALVHTPKNGHIKLATCPAQ